MRPLLTNATYLAVRGKDNIMGNSLAIRTVAYICKLGGQDYFRDILSPAIAEIEKTPQLYQLPVSRHPRKPVHKKHQVQHALASMAQAIINKAVAANCSMPAVMRTALFLLRREMIVQLPYADELAVREFFFHRLMCAAIVKPHEQNVTGSDVSDCVRIILTITDTAPGYEVELALQSVSRVVLAIGCGELFDTHNDDFSCFNSLVQSNNDTIANMTDSISSRLDDADSPLEAELVQMQSWLLPLLSTATDGLSGYFKSPDSAAGLKEAMRAISLPDEWPGSSTLELLMPVVQTAIADACLAKKLDPALNMSQHAVVTKKPGVLSRLAGAKPKLVAQEIEAVLEL